jgi:hypothetical protein
MSLRFEDSWGLGIAVCGPVTEVTLWDAHISLIVEAFSEFL